MNALLKIEKFYEIYNLCTAKVDYCKKVWWIDKKMDNGIIIYITVGVTAESTFCLIRIMLNFVHLFFFFFVPIKESNKKVLFPAYYNYII